MKKFIFLFVFALSLVTAKAQETRGVVIPGTIAPTDSLDNYSTHDDYFGRVGFRIVKNITERDLIPEKRRIEGMVVFDQTTRKMYKLEDCLSNTCWIDYRIDTLFGGTHSTGRITVQPSIFDPSFLYDAYTKDGYQRFGVSKNGFLMAGRRFPMAVNVDGLAMIGDRNEVTGADAGAFGKDVEAVSDSSLAIGYNLKTQHINTILLGRGPFRSQKLKTRWPNSFGIGYGQENPQITLSKDTIKFESEVLWWNGAPIGGGGSQWENTPYGISYFGSIFPNSIKKEYNNTGSSGFISNDSTSASSILINSELNRGVCINIDENRGIGLLAYWNHGKVIDVRMNQANSYVIHNSYNYGTTIQEVNVRPGACTIRGIYLGSLARITNTGNDTAIVVNNTGNVIYQKQAALYALKNGGVLTNVLRGDGKQVIAQIQASLTDGTPTTAQITSAVGESPSDVRAGYQATIKDTDGTGLLYKIESDGTDWFYTVMTKSL